MPQALTRVQQSAHLLLFCIYYLIVLLAVGYLLGPDEDQVGPESFRMLLGQGLVALLLLPAIWLSLHKNNEGAAQIGLIIPRSWAQTLGVGTLLGIGIKFAIVPVGLIAFLLGVRGEVPPVSLETGGDLIALVLAGSLAALIEETMFRGYLRLRVAEVLRDPNPIGALSRTGLCTSFLFSLGHGYQGWLGIVITLVVGMLLYQIATSKRFNLTHCVVAHAAFNAISFLLLAAIDPESIPLQ